MVLGEPLDHALGPVAEGDQAGGRQDADLAHAAADELAGATGARDEAPLADHDRADRAGQALREAERGAVGAGRAELRRSVPQRHRPRSRGGHRPRGVARPCSCGDPADARGVARRSAAGPSMARACSPASPGPSVAGGRPSSRCERARMSSRAISPSGPAGTWRTVAPLMTAWPPASCSTTCAPLEATISPPRATWAMCETRLPMVPLATNSAGLLAGQLGGALLERDDGGVVAEDVVADLGLGHRAAHRRRGLGDGVGAKVDEVGHGRRA